ELRQMSRLDNGETDGLREPKEFDNILSQTGNKLVVVAFTASWCGPCQMMGPKLAEDSTNKDVIFLKVDVDKASDVRKHCAISCTYHFYKNGNKVSASTR
uniref:Thioredoxin domain-containing protein n=1 Tax=Poecilia reticulata TaxID=8081 RepID=A0A3P9NA22_POERE